MRRPALLPRPTVVINADDFGGSHDVNQAILASFEHGWATTATMMANMPAFADACTAVCAHKLQDRIGVHLNLTEGPPLSEPILGCPRLCTPSGQLGAIRGPLWRLTATETQAIEAEFTAQIDALLAFGITPSHLDSHHHVHTHWAVSSVVIRLARRYGVPAIRLTRNCGSSPGLAKQIYKTVFNTRLTRAGLAPTRHFGSAEDVASLSRFAGPVEIMVHPSLDDAGEVVDVTTGSGRLQDVATHWRTVGTLVSYRELRAP